MAAISRKGPAIAKRRQSSGRPRSSGAASPIDTLAPYAARLLSLLGDARRNALATTAWLLVAIATIFGGATQTNALSLMVVELASLPLLCLAIAKLLKSGVQRELILPMAILGCVVALPLLELAPLPQSLWSRLPGRAPELAAVNLARLGQVTLPISMTPEYTWRSLLALLPPAAMFLAAVQLSDGQRRVAAAIWLMLGVVSVVIGLFQVAGGADSPFYFYKITNAGAPVGLFANRNHEAAFLYSLLVLSMVFVAAPRDDRRGGLRLHSAFAALFSAVCLVGVAITLSRAGLVLAAAAVIGCILLALRAGAFHGRWRAAALLGLPVAAGAAAVVLFRLAPIVSRFDLLGGQEMRFEGWPLVLKAAKAFAPIGSGIGSFDVVYRSVEPLDQVSPVYFNHAHNDFLELWLETSWIGAILLAVFLIWLAWRLWVVGSRRTGSGVIGLSSASALIVLLLLAHSAVDYPLRTEAIAVLFAFCCAVLAARSGSRRSRPHLVSEQAVPPTELSEHRRRRRVATPGS